jgi:hypothetical protein
MSESSINPGSIAGLHLDIPGGRPKENARAWEVYKTELREGDLNGEPFIYLVETGEPTILALDDLKEAELFNGTLQTVDVTDPESVLGFVNKFGMPVSPMYQGKMRLEWFRHRNVPGMRTFSPIPTADPEQAGRMVNPVPFHLAKLDSPASLLAELGDDLKGDMPYVLSERARELENGNEATVGAVSLAEVAQTIRVLQMATALPMAFSYFAGNHGTGEDLVGYLKTPRYVAQAGPGYFLHVDASIVGGARLDTLECCLEVNEQLQHDVDIAREQGFNVEAGFSSALAKALWKSSNNALRWLSESDICYRTTDFLWDDEPVREANPFAAFSRKRRQKTLPDFFEHGSLGEAIVHQYLTVFTDERPFRRCENCGRIFKKYREEGFMKNIRETRFCRRSCNVSFNQKNKDN